MLQIASGKTLDGGGATESGGYYNLSNLKGVTLRNWVLNNVQFKFTDCDDLVFDNVVFNGSGGQENGRCLSMFGTFNRFILQKSTFNNVNCDSCVFFDHCGMVDNKLVWNRFDNVTHGMHISVGGALRRNDVEIASNYFNKVLVFSVEAQNGFNGLKIHHNYSENFRARSSRMAFSIATGPSDNTSVTTQQATYATGVQVYANFFDDPARTGPPYNDAYAVCELMGADSQFFNNMAFGPYGALVLLGWNRDACKIFNNVWAGYGDPNGTCKLEKMGVRLPAGNVYGNQLLPASAVAALRAGLTVDKVLNGQMAWQAGSSGIAPAIVIDSNAPSLTAQARAGVAGTIDVSLKNTPAGKVQRRPTSGAGDVYVWTDVSDVVAGPCSLADQGPANGSGKLPSRWVYDYRLIDSGGHTIVTGQAQVNDLPVPDEAAPTPTVTPTPTVPTVTPTPTDTTGVVTLDELTVLEAALADLTAKVQAMKAKLGE